MVVHVRGYLTFRAVLGQRRVEVEEHASLRSLLERLGDELGEPFAAQVFDRHAGLRPYVALLVNGRHHTHTEAGLSLRLHDGDEVAVFPPMAGG
jgi:MoaD family protein